MYPIEDRAILEKAAKIKLAIFDVDGVLTDGGLYLSDSGQEYKKFHSKDGLGMKLLQQSGTPIAIITARKSELVRIRMQSLGIKHIYQGQEDKRPAFERLINSLNIDREEVAYIGDDLIDLPILANVGLAVVVADAHPHLIPKADFVTRLPGGRGAAREVCELIMQGQGKLDGVYADFAN